MKFPSDKEVIEMYESGMFANEIAKKYNSYCDKVTRILRKNGIKLFHEREKKDLPISLKVKYGFE